MHLTDPLFLIAALIGLAFEIMGYISLRYPPKHINGVYGYRTKRSLKSQERWDFAQEYSTCVMINSGIVLILLGLSGYLLTLESWLSITLGLTAAIGFTVVIIYTTERALVQKFPDNKT